MANRILVGGPTFQQAIDLGQRPWRIAGAQTHQGALFHQLDLRQIDSSFVIRSGGAFVKLCRARQIAKLAIKISVGFERFSQLPDHVEKLASLQRQVEMLRAPLHLAAIEITTREVQMSCRLLRNWRQGRIAARHLAKPAQRFAKISAHHRRQAQIVSNQSCMMFIMLALSRLESYPKLPFSGGPLGLGYKAEAASIHAFRADN